MAAMLGHGGPVADDAPEVNTTPVVDEGISSLPPAKAGVPVTPMARALVMVESFAGVANPFSLGRLERIG